MRVDGLVSLSVATLVTGCLPGDTRPPPGHAFVTTEPSEAVADGFTTADGWTISFDRLLAALGNLSLHGSDCVSYSSARYSRLYDFAVGGRQKLGEVYGLGSCGLWVHLRSPDYDAVLMEGATAADVTQMRIADFDDWSVSYADWEGEGRRVTMLVRGTATRGEVTKTFDWTFRQRYAMQTCPPGPNGGTGNLVDLRAEEDIEVGIVLHGEELFRSAADDEAELHFDPFADADADADGVVTLAEMADEPAPPPSVESASSSSEADTLADFVYLTMLPRTVRIGGSGACEAEKRRGQN